MYTHGYQGHGIDDMAQIYREHLAFATSLAWHDNNGRVIPGKRMADSNNSVRAYSIPLTQTFFFVFCFEEVPLSPLSLLSFTSPSSSSSAIPCSYSLHKEVAPNCSFSD